MSLPTTAAERKAMPVCTGVLDYFPDALAAVAELSRIGNAQHNPGQPLHWAREKSTDHADCIVRHLMERGTIDTDGQRHAAKVAWRALALLQTEIEKDRAKQPSLEVAMAALEARANRAPEMKFGFRVGEPVNHHRYKVGEKPGKVVGFKDDIVLVWWDHWGERDETSPSEYAPAELRHGI